MKKFWGVLALVVILVLICVSEEVIINNALTKIKEESNYLFSICQDLENVNTEEIIEKSKKLKDFWEEEEFKLCFFINYKDVGEMSNEIVRLVSYSENNVKEEFMTSLLLLIYYCDTFDHITGLNLQNIF